jgi:hypothetical protein
MPGTPALLVSCVAAALLLASCGSAGGGRIALTAAPDKPGTRVAASADGEQAIVEIFSPQGIGGADIEITSARMPTKIVMRLHLRGLEELRLAYGGTVVTAALSSAGDNSVRQRRQAGAASGSPEEALAETSPYWMSIRIVPAGGAPAAIPLEEGYIEVEAPRDLLTRGQRAFSIHWIDFYR